MNDNTPTFDQNSYDAGNLILENVLPGTEILTVRAKDADGSVSRRRILSNTLSLCSYCDVMLLM